MNALSQWGASLAPIPLRFAIGSIFVLHGYEKIFVNGTDVITESFAQLGIVQPHLMGPLVSYTEFIGGILLILGLFTPVASLALAFVMLVAVLQVQLPHILVGYVGYEFPLSLLAGSVALFLLGPGSLSLDQALFSRGGLSDKQ